MPAWLRMFYRDFKIVPGTDIEIKREIGVVHTTGEEDYMRIGKPKIIAYTVSQRLEDLLKIAYVNIGDVYLPDYSKTTSKKGIYIERIMLPCDETKINWHVLNYLDRLVDCNVPKVIKQEFGINIIPYYKKSKKEDDLVPIRNKHWAYIEDKYFIGG
jgi:hypothetical protein